ncbi:PREDICTED: uncharacterized protein LOC105362697 [Ceratosolen solmsi marchali]|uniref:Uncharacterized protein LOC105362697 n=1 Tax=Ceratosolen solmsi marchali TaxID=326594 RepID=A0AAJ6YI43_9HYME|nr:PREDICTED: uncharacterized protein LOC105362697 [Ceratosolen solmsi marchali]
MSWPLIDKGFFFILCSLRSKQWVQACERNDLLEKTPIELFNSYRVCAKHFSDSMFLNDLRNRLQPNSVPMQVDWQEDSNDSIDSEKKKDEFLEAQDPIAKILSNCILQKISADEFFKATGICIQEPVSTVKATKDYVQSSNLSDHIYSSTKTVTNNVINIGDNTMTIDMDNDNTNSFSIEALSYEDLTDTLPTSMINAPDIELSAIDISELSFMNADDKTLCINKIPESILEGDDESSIMNNTSNTVRTIEATTQTDTKIFKDKLEVNQIKSQSPDDKVEKIIQTEINFIENKLDETTQTEFSFLKYKLNKRRLKKVLQKR